MASKYAALPDLDTTQDVYETPDLDVDLSTIPTTVSDTASDAGSDRSIDRSHLLPSSARHAFDSPSVAEKRRAFRRRGEYGDVDDEEYGDEEETLEVRMARLKREVEELRAEVRARDEGRGYSGEGEGEEGMGQEGGEEGVARGEGMGAEGDGFEGGDGLIGSVEEIADVLESLTVIDKEERGAHARLARKLVVGLPAAAAAAGQKKEDDAPAAEGEAASAPAPKPEDLNSEDPAVADRAAKAAFAALQPSTTSFTINYTPSFKKSHTLGLVADFDSRLAVLEKVLGMSTSALASPDAALPTHAMIPTIQTLNKQIGTLTSATTSSLDAASRRVKVLVSETEKLTEARRLAAAAARDAPESIEADETVAKINALYGTLPVVEQGREVLPAVLERLRSLRAVHGEAARAAETLGEVERRQMEMEAEIRKWEQALAKVEEVVRESEGGIKGNMDKVEGWVKEVEEKWRKVEALGKA